ncbi:MAG: hypothetical protein ACREVQ_09440 [Burkholderiales bacterium]
MALETPIASFDFASGVLRGTQLSLFGTRLLHHGPGYMESMTLDGISAVRVAYARNLRGISWGAVLAVVALVLFLVSGPLAGLATEGASDVNGTGSIAHLLRATLLFLGAIASILPALGLGCLIGGVALAGFGWFGATTLALSMPGGEREFGVRGRNRMLVDFADLLAERVAQHGR